MNIRRLVLDVDKALKRPSLIELARALDACSGVEGLNIAVDEHDSETVGMIVAVEGENRDDDEIVEAAQNIGAMVYSIDEMAAGSRVVGTQARRRNG